MFNVGFVGHGSDKFDARTELIAKELIYNLLDDAEKTHGVISMVSGHSPVGGIDIWAEEIALGLGILLDLKIPKQQKWDSHYGYKQRNLDIARSCDTLHVILVKNYPENYNGQRFNLCYHCKTSDHVKSGGCWTGKQAKKLGKEVIWHIIE
jgi:hypothetical protein